MIGVEVATLLQEQHVRKIHFCGNPPQKLVGAVPAEMERLEQKSTVSYDLFKKKKTVGTEDFYLYKQWKHY
ncbi:hypothetical protein [Lysinibacillus sphaericus]|uniref:hypothetical protein n=1 Tax=Lysinibacillus sphaericus TaxID=1421 RepID=UPI003D02A27D